MVGVCGLPSRCCSGSLPTLAVDTLSGERHEAACTPQMVGEARLGNERTVPAASRRSQRMPAWARAWRCCCKVVGTLICKLGGVVAAPVESAAGGPSFPVKIVVVRANLPLLWCKPGFGKPSTPARQQALGSLQVVFMVTSYWQSSIKQHAPRAAVTGVSRYLESHLGVFEGSGLLSTPSRLMSAVSNPWCHGESWCWIPESKSIFPGCGASTWVPAGICKRGGWQRGACMPGDGVARGRPGG